LSLLLHPEEKVGVSVDLPTKLRDRGKLPFQMKIDTMVRDNEENVFCHMLHLKYHMYMNLFLKVQIPTPF
jgi:hypothetical protein